ncbi:MAG: hypothetical protein AAB261_01955 [Chloroflexota bacterium]
MPKVSYTKENMPKKPGEMMKALREAAKTTTPIDDLIDLTREMVHLEIKYKMSSEEFYQKFNKGEMGDRMEIMHWVGTYEMYKRLKQKLEKIVQKHYATPTPVLTPVPTL